MDDIILTIDITTLSLRPTLPCDRGRCSPHGFAVAAVAVRSSSQATFPAQVHDGKAAVRWLRAHARRYHLDPGRFAAMGNSSGGWLAAMLGDTGGVARLEGDLGPRGCGPVRTFTGPPVTWDALARHLTRTLAGQDRRAA